MSNTPNTLLIAAVAVVLGAVTESIQTSSVTNMSVGVVSVVVLAQFALQVIRMLKEPKQQNDLRERIASLEANVQWLREELNRKVNKQD